MNPVFITYAALAVAVACEVTATTLLKLSDQFTRPLPTAAMALCYLASFFFLSVTLRHLPIGVAYAVWSGLGIVLISTIGFVVFRQTLDFAAVIGLGFIVVGVITVNVFSTTPSP